MEVSNHSSDRCRSALFASFIYVPQSPTSVQADPRSGHGASRGCTTATATGPRESTILHPNGPSWLKSAAPWLALVILTVILYGRGMTQSKGAFGDAFHHLMNGIFVLDAASDPVSSLSDPLAFGIDYYQHFPAVNIGYYPPFFPIMEAGVMSVVGVSPVAGQLTVLILAVAMALLAFAWLRLRFDPWWAMGTVVVLISTPLLVTWGKDIMLEVPTLAFMLGGMWGFERILRADKPSWSSVCLWALFSILALWTKQHAILILGVFGAGLITTGRWRHYIHPRVFVGGVAILLALGGIIKMTLSVGGAAVGHTLGHNRQHVADRFNVEQWTFYLRNLPEFVTWPTLILAGVGLVFVLRRRVPYASLLLLWLASFYVMHSYFKGQTARYACLWLPPFFVLAASALKQIPWRIPLRVWPARMPNGLPVGGVVLTLWAGFSIATAATIAQPPVPDAYQHAAGDLRDRLSPFTCMTFFPDHPGRMSVCYRLAIEDDTRRPRAVNSYGRIVRAGQVLANWRDQWSSAAELDASLKRWNVKYIATEVPRPIDVGARDDVVASGVEAVLALGTYRVVRNWPVYWAGHSVDERTLLLYERVEPMTFNPNENPTLALTRTAIRISGSGGSTKP